MEQAMKRLEDTCNFSGVKPAMVELPYPPIAVREKNQRYANLLSNDYCGSVSEMSAITQYINNENKMSCEQCPYAKIILAIAMAEMIHLQKLGQLIHLLGGEIDYTAKLPNGKVKLWTPSVLTLPDNIKQMFIAGIEFEKAAIHQYQMHINAIRDDNINAILRRIMKDEEYHIMILRALLEE